MAIPKLFREPGGGFNDAVYRIVAAIPFGYVTSYGEIARALGKPKAARAVGWAMRAADGMCLPCHRVVAKAGNLAPQDTFGPGLQRALLEDEGVSFTLDGMVDMARHLWIPETH